MTSHDVSAIFFCDENWIFSYLNHALLIKISIILSNHDGNHVLESKGPVDPKDDTREGPGIGLVRQGEDSMEKRVHR